MRKWISPLAGCFILWAGVAACQGQATQTSPADQPSRAAGVETPAARSTTSASSAGTPSLAPFAVDLTLPFAFATPQPWSPQAYAGTPIALPVDLAGVANPHVLDGLTEAQRSFLAENGFVVIRSGEQQFNDIRYGTAFALGQPFFRTTDEAYHALHLLFDDLLKALERQVLRPEMARILLATRDEVRSFADETAGTALEGDVQLAEAYLDVAIHLFDPEAPDSQALPDLVAQQIDQILAAGGRDKSVLFPGFEDDYGAYKPVGHYAGDPGLEHYFRGLTWLGRVHFPLAQADDPAFQPSRLPLVITLALRRAEADGKPASEAWADVHRTLDFLIGPTDDAGPIEYAQLMDQVYGPNATPLALADEARWVEFQASAADLPAPQINSIFVDWTADLAVEKGWRFMGQRFTMDANIFQNLVFDKVLP
ncbi:MAG: DUF3160 domain-containing protein, partial [Anaerolineales bacterium]|nr:DUF3160 domain-containing protein [Anaerolineales bacterium]